MPELNLLNETAGLTRLSASLSGLGKLDVRCALLISRRDLITENDIDALDTNDYEEGNSDDEDWDVFSTYEDAEEFSDLGPEDREDTCINDSDF